MIPPRLAKVANRHYDGWVSKKLEALLLRAKARQMTAEERERQVFSFAYGNLSIEQPGVTREQIAAAARDSSADGERGLVQRRRG
jgi:hypothetical protein